ncbi:hypothetical protein CPB83DRAFT_812894 [Crepidotus variabilis]|uniref:Protein kinase domain-containing protein n=1 Tax=Crepidotus variabilis TaxID=179855 RepID=A0A9P6EHB4_9AGAR|nr:hypothetical protein CPB83DRAFT_812894 [Crepidotus variabilis]
MPRPTQNVPASSPNFEARSLLQNSPSNTTVRQLAPSPSIASCSPLSTSTSRFVTFSEAPVNGGNFRKRTSTAVSDVNTSFVGGQVSARTSPVPPGQTRSRSRISQSGSMANIMNLVKSRSKSRVGRVEGLDTPSLEDGPETGWFGKACNFVKTLGDSDSEDDAEGDPVKDAASEERQRKFVETREMVLMTLKKVVGCVGEIALDSLIASVALIEYAPFPCLQKVCTTFISIWKAIQMVTMNRLAFLRLVQTCGSILESIHKELDGAEEHVIQELKAPIGVLETSFESILSSVRSHINTPFLWRYARREETSKEIAGCHDSLMKALALFTTTIQLRTYQAVRANARACAENQAQLLLLTEHVVHGSPSQNTIRNLSAFPTDIRRASAPESETTIDHNAGLSGLAASPTITSKSVDTFFPGGLDAAFSPSTSNAMAFACLLGSSTTSTPAPTTPSSFSSRAIASTTTTPRAQVIPVLQEIHTSQNIEDRKADIEEMRSRMRMLLDRGNDIDILRFLGIDEKDIPEAIKTLQRMLENLCGGVGWGGQGHCRARWDGEVFDDNLEAPDSLHQEFIESGIEALRRMSKGLPELPYWTITPFEVKKGPKIGAGFFSDVFMGQWGKRYVAVKVLSSVTPSDLFIREIKVWKDLDHANVLKLYGASSATGNPPWFFVSEYMRYGNLAEFLRRVGRLDEGEMKLVGWGMEKAEIEGLTMSRSMSGWGGGFGSCVGPSEWPAFGGIQTRRVLRLSDVYRMMQEVARGMEYIHSKGVLHGDLKASNVLVDNNYRCVISDFGQSELKTEVCRLTGSSMKTGTLRWKAPELLEGSGMLTPFTDIYAYGIVCIEILTMGEIPWGVAPDDDIRHNVLEMDRRPLIPVDFTSPLLHELIQACWDREPLRRMPFREVVTRLTRLRVIESEGSDPSVTNLSIQENSDISTAPTSPIWPISPCTSPISFFSRPLSPTPTPYTDSMESFDDHDDFVALPSPQEVEALRIEDDIVPSRRSSVHRISGVWQMPEPTHYTTDLEIQQGGSQDTETTVANSENDLSRSMDLGAQEGRSSPPPTNERAVEARNERRYRYLLEHEFNSSLTLPLWEPSPVAIGDVGYLSKPRGAFISLFNAIKPMKSMIINFPSMAEYGSVTRGSLQLDKRTAAQKSIDAFSGFLAFRSKNEATTTHRQSFRLRSGHKSAHIYAESAEYVYMKKVDAAKAWFKDNIDQVLVAFAAEHDLQKDDVFLVISALQSKSHALIVSHRHPTGQAHFNVHPVAKKGQPWGAFSFDTSQTCERHGPSYEEPEHVEHEYASKISLVNDPMKAVLVGRLRYKPDSMEPTTSR